MKIDTTINEISENPKWEKTKYYLYLISKNRLFMLGLIITLLLIAVAVLAPWIATHPGDAFGDINLSARLKPPSSDYLMGTDNFGRDIFSRLVYGTRLSILAGVCIVLIALIIGVPLGLIAGYYGGKVDEIIMRICDGFLSFPYLLLPIVIGAYFKGSLNIDMMVVNMLVLGLIWWPWYVRILRAQVLIVREHLYIEAAKAIGVKDSTIIISHVIANSIGPLSVQVSLDVGYAILASASLSFIGIGATPPTAEWGYMVSASRPYFHDFWWTTFFPGLAIFLAVIAFNLLGDGLREIFDPKTR
ncbi:ABC transporter permease [bacterium]|nr:ABC transporter permease [bacterium]